MLYVEQFHCDKKEAEKKQNKKTYMHTITHIYTKNNIHTIHT